MKTWRRTQDAGLYEGAKSKYLLQGFMSNKPWGSGERFEIFFRYYNTSIQGIPVWKEQVEPKLQKEELDEGVAGGGHHLPGLHLSRR